MKIIIGVEHSFATNVECPNIGNYCLSLAKKVILALKDYGVKDIIVRVGSYEVQNLDEYLKSDRLITEFPDKNALNSYEFLKSLRLPTNNVQPSDICLYFTSGRFFGARFPVTPPCITRIICGGDKGSMSKTQFGLLEQSSRLSLKKESMVVSKHFEPLFACEYGDGDDDLVRRVTCDLFPKEYLTLRIGNIVQEVFNRGGHPDVRPCDVRVLGFIKAVELIHMQFEACIPLYIDGSAEEEETEEVHDTVNPLDDKVEEKSKTEDLETFYPSEDDGEVPSEKRSSGDDTELVEESTDSYSLGIAGDPAKLSYSEDATVYKMLSYAMEKMGVVALAQLSENERFVVLRFERSEDVEYLLTLNLLPEDDKIHPDYSSLVAAPAPLEEEDQQIEIRKQDPGNDEFLPSYVSNAPAWFDASHVSADFQKIIRQMKRLPEKRVAFYQEVNRFRYHCIITGQSDFLEEIGAALRAEAKTMSRESQRHAEFVAAAFSKPLDPSNYKEVPALF